MKIKILIIGLTALFAVGCFTFSTQLNNVHLGMTEAEVVKILGQPVSMAENKDGSKMLYYELAERGAGPMPYSVKLVNGKVDSYGRDSGATPQKTEPMPVIVPMVH